MKKITILLLCVCSTFIQAQSKKAVEAFNNGEAFYDDEDYSSAIASFKKALKKEPTYADALYYIGMSCYMIDRYQEAVQYFNTLEQHHSDYWAWFYYARGYSNTELGEVDKAINDYEKFLVKYPKTADYISDRHSAKFKLDYLKGQKELLKQKPTMKEPVNLGSKVNTEYGDYAPYIDPKGEKMYFTSNRKSKFSTDKNEDDVYDEDIYSSKIVDANFKDSYLLPAPFNTKENDAVDSFSGDGQLISYTKSAGDDGVGSTDIFISTSNGEKWTTPQNLGNVVNSSEWDSSSSISADGTIIVFASEREGGYGSSDIYMIRKNKFGDWGIPQNLGSKINTPFSDASPFIAPDGKTLYFSSTGHPGYGDFDIFMSKFKNGTWSTPQNLGKPLNSKYTDRYFTIPASGEFAVFSSDREGGYGKEDLYKVEIPESMRPQPTIILSGIVKNSKTKKPMDAWVLIEDLDSGELIATNKSNPNTGDYTIILPSGRNYAVTANQKGYFFYSQNFKVTEKSNYQEVKKDIELKPIEKGTRVVLNNVFFESGKAKLSPTSLLELKKAVDLMTENPTMKIEIGGHTDNVGNEALNMKLSHERAKSVRQHLINSGVNPNKIIAKGYGSTNPIADNTTDEGKAANRRTEFIIVEY